MGQRLCRARALKRVVSDSRLIVEKSRSQLLELLLA